MKTRRDRGSSLIEMMAYMVILGTIVGASCSAYIYCLKNSRSIVSNSEDIARTIKAGEQWREDLRASSGGPVLDAGVLHVPQGEGEVLYRLRGGTVERRTGEQAGWTALLTGVEDSVMKKEVHGGIESWRWEVELHSRKTPLIEPLFTFRAVAGLDGPLARILPAEDEE